MSLPAERAQISIYGSGDTSAVPDDVQYYEVTPGVVSTNGSEPFRVYVHLGRAAKRVYWSRASIDFAVSRTDLLDDGTEGDLVAGDGIYTSGIFVVNHLSLPLRYLEFQPTLDGMDYSWVGDLAIEETDGSGNTFLIAPQIGLLEPSVPTARVAVLSADLQAASHLVNIRRTGAPAAQGVLHSLGADSYASLQNLTQSVYGCIPDEYDFMIILSATHGEKIPRTASSNFNAGMHLAVRNSITGIGLGVFDDTTRYGSSGRLLGVSLLDTAERGNYINNALHEITHQWVTFLDFSLGLSDSDRVHWHAWSSIGSIVGGFAWIPQPDGSWLIDGEQYGARLCQMPPLDRYLAGFLPAAEVPPSMVYDPSSRGPYSRFLDGDRILPKEVVTIVTIEDIIACHGERTPAPREAQRHFAVLFVVESLDRLLTPNEITFYNRLASEFERVLAPAEPTPILTQNWVPATRYFGPTVTLSSRVTSWDTGKP